MNVPLRYGPLPKPADIPPVTPEEIAHNPGYNCGRPSLPPFEYVEAYKVFESRNGRIAVGLIAFGAYNALGLIGTEGGGLAFVCERPEKAVFATKILPWAMEKRAAAFKALVAAVENAEEPAEALRDAIKGQEGWNWR